MEPIEDLSFHDIITSLDPYFSQVGGDCSCRQSYLWLAEQWTETVCDYICLGRVQQQQGHTFTTWKFKYLNNILFKIILITRDSRRIILGILKSALRKCRQHYMLFLYAQVTMLAALPPEKKICGC